MKNISFYFILILACFFTVSCSDNDKLEATEDDIIEDLNANQENDENDYSLKIVNSGQVLMQDNPMAIYCQDIESSGVEILVVTNMSDFEMLLDPEIHTEYENIDELLKVDEYIFLYMNAEHEEKFQFSLGVFKVMTDSGPELKGSGQICIADYCENDENYLISFNTLSSESIDGTITIKDEGDVYEFNLSTTDINSDICQ